MKNFVRRSVLRNIKETAYVSQGVSQGISQGVSQGVRSYQAFVSQKGHSACASRGSAMFCAAFTGVPEVYSCAYSCCGQVEPRKVLQNTKTEAAASVAPCLEDALDAFDLPVVLVNVPGNVKQEVVQGAFGEWAIGVREFLPSLDVFNLALVLGQVGVGSLEGSLLLRQAPFLGKLQALFQQLVARRGCLGQRLEEPFRQMSILFKPSLISLSPQVLQRWWGHSCCSFTSPKECPE